LSTLGQPHIEPAWKQEVNRRLAAHKNRKGAENAPQTPQESHRLGSSRAAEAAARVAARYAKAPTYTQMQAEEARVAVRAAEIATHVALQAQAVAEDALAELHAAAQEPPMRGPAVVESIARAPRAESAAPAMLPEYTVGEERAVTPAPPATSIPSDDDFIAPEPAAPQQTASHPVAIRWEADIPVRVLDRKPAPAEEHFELAAEDWWTPAQVGSNLHNEPITVEAQSTHANLIEFPRELVATRRMRPRLVEAPAASLGSGEAQLSIFEVDPGSVSTEPPLTSASDQASTWSGAEGSGAKWSGMELDEHPATETAPAADLTPAAQRIFLAPIGLRLMASVVDSSLILGAFFASATLFASRVQHLPVGRPAEITAAAGVVLAGFLYHALFFAFGVSTPGMRYAGIALCTFDEDLPTRAQMRSRLGAMALSLAPVGLGFAWSIFDEDHLSWHDRISQTYLRKRH
jgi:uncharacterized RDD family membrane protein YckC